MKVDNSQFLQKATLIWLFVLSAIIFSILTFEIYSEYKKSLDNAKIKVDEISSIISKKLSNDFNQIDNILELAKNMINNLPNENTMFQTSNSDGKKSIIEHKLKIFAKNISSLDEILYIDKDGFVIASSNSIANGVNIKDRDYFHKISNDRGINKGFSNVVITKTNPREAFVQYSVIRDKNRELLGIVAAIINKDTIDQTISMINKTSSTDTYIIDKNNLSFQLSSSDKKLNPQIVTNLQLDKNIQKLRCKNEDIISSIKYLDGSSFIVLSTLSSEIYLENYFNKFKILLAAMAVFLALSILFYLYVTKNYKREITLLRELKGSKSRFENMFRIHSAIMLLVNPKTGNIIDANNSAVNFYGYSLDEITKIHISQINVNLYNEMSEASNLDKNRFIFQHRLKNGELKTVEVNSSPIDTPDGVLLFSIIKDITREKITEDKLLKSYELQKKLINLQENIIILTNGIEIEFVNDKFLSFFDFESIEEFNEKHSCICDLFKDDINLFSLSKIQNRDLWIEELEKRDDSQRLVKIDDSDKIEHIFAINISLIDEMIKIISFTDITKTVARNIYLEDKILKDKLTNSFNREFFDRNHRDFIKNYHISDSLLAVAMLDIDHFKYVNDTYGHDAGDVVLQEFVTVINNNIRENDYLIRWGGEEFVLILKIRDESYLEKILEKLRIAVASFSFYKVGHRTSSFGGTIYKADEDIMQTIKRADNAVYIAKQEGRNRVVIL